MSKAIEDVVRQLYRECKDDDRLLRFVANIVSPRLAPLEAELAKAAEAVESIEMISELASWKSMDGVCIRQCEKIVRVDLPDLNPIFARGLPAAARLAVEAKRAADTKQEKRDV